MKKIVLTLSLISGSLILGGCAFSSDALFPSLVGSSSQEAYNADKNAPESADLPMLGSSNFEPLEVSEGGDTGTFVGQKVIAFRNELSQLQNAIRTNNSELQKIRASVISNASQYHKTIGAIEAKLQVGTTPGNPQMYAMLQSAQNNVQLMTVNSNALQQLSARVTSDASVVNNLLDSIRATFAISGAVDEDHRQLRILQNETNQTAILIGSLLNEVNSDVVRQIQYNETANSNIVQLDSAIKRGNYGVSNVPLGSSVPVLNLGNKPAAMGYAPANGSLSGAVAGKPLFVAKFNKSNVNYKDGLRRAVNAAKSKKPNVVFEVVAVIIAHPSDLYKEGHWHEYQKFLFDNQLRQPFKQVFRELYVKLQEELDKDDSRMFSGNQIQPQKTVGALRSRRWVADYEDGLQKIYYKENIVARIYAMADWFSPSDVEAPTLEWVVFSDRKTFKPLKIREIPDVLYSEVMRDVDLAVSVAHAGGVDPETSHSTVEMRKAIVECNLELFKIKNVRLEGSHAFIDGKLGQYTVHLGSGVVHQMGNAMLFVVPVHSQHRGRIFLPFVDDDPKTAEIMSKILLFAEDNKIKDPTILEQIR